MKLGISDTVIIELKVQMLENRVAEVLSRLPNSVGRERCLGAYASLLIAESLGYINDRFRQRDGGERRRLLPHVARAVLSPSSAWDAPTNEWMSSFYFNNALLRMAATAEIALMALFKRKNPITELPKGRNIYWRLSKWYLQNCGGKTTELDRTRREINDFKHGRSEQEPLRKVESLNDGLMAFEELLLLMERLADAQPGAPADGPRPAGSARG